MADIDYEQPSTFPYDGRQNTGEYRNEAIDLRNYVVETGPEDGFNLTKKGAGMWGWGNYVVLKGPLKVVASSENLTDETHVSEIVTIPRGKTVKFQNYQDRELADDINLHIAPVLKPLQFPPVGPLFRLKLFTKGYPLHKQFWWFKYDVDRVE